MLDQDTKDTIREVVGESHQALASVQSRSNSEVMIKLGILETKQDETNRHLRELNGKAVTNAKDIQGLKEEKLVITSSFKTLKWTGAIFAFLIVTLLSVAGYAYTQDKLNLQASTASVANSLINYQTEAQSKQQEIINLLGKINNK